MPKIVDYESKKQEIIEKARIVFAKRGYRNTNLSHISKKCGMGRTTLYQYFNNKDEIFYHTMGLTLEEIKSQVQVIVVNNQLTFVEKLKEIIHQLTDEQKHNNTFILLLEVWLVLKRENNDTLEKLKEYTKELKMVIEELIKEAIIAKEIKPIDSKSLAETIYTFIETFTLQRTSNNLDAKVKVESLNLLIDGLKA
ncbi:TetR/AcrR family transcriptional regulator [Clostridium sp. Cult2]|uniref:TetR/AcrR family transcriptional regulator n=1 Tax=Clostridium sp. Cult2 TaxID=2079003 RepID=UPI001F3CAE9E|nr:TetR/AcrR family transcriptional regulator [Clostridium sp. Cult2]MCF6465714.1 TetR/AcrR family transcriptional regulator [Clostridium sp. Cult2]